ncbi:A-agglutinin anchorage subunit-like [Haliotis rufescens]|uniref:A-agglutinin anchorage subunit-like n=1 Tax=Haliotis rufescens TaxID=6454 RepID=UPI00201F96B3|nr:A-agglutinin anchorage subunit-like [Haliotis rufescens]
MANARPGNLLVFLVVILQIHATRSASLFNLEVNFASGTIIEGQGEVNVTISRGGGTEESNVTYTVASPTDPVPVIVGTFSAAFAENVTEVVVSVEIINDTVAEVSQAFTVTIESASSGTIGTFDSLTFSIADDDQVPADWSAWVEGTCGGSCDSRFRTDTRTRTCSNFGDPLRVNCITSDSRTVSCPTDCTTTTTELPTTTAEVSTTTTKVSTTTTKVSTTTTEVSTTTTSPSTTEPSNTTTAISTATPDLNTTAEPECDANWTEWSCWTVSRPCSVTCGEGSLYQMRRRTCSVNNGCAGRPLEMRTAKCLTPDCKDC